MAYKRPRSLPKMAIHLVRIYLRRYRIAVTFIALTILVVVILIGSLMAFGLSCGSKAKHQRAAVAPVANQCADPAVGQWAGYQHLDGFKYDFLLSIKRAEGGEHELEGNIRSHYWAGPATSTAPGSCAMTSDQEFVVNMAATGSQRGSALSFDGESWRQRSRCGPSRGQYIPDRFAGELSEDGTEFHAINDDGYNDATVVVFRRVACEP